MNYGAIPVENRGTKVKVSTQISSIHLIDTPTEDSVIFEHRCGAHITRDSIAETALPAAVNEYLSANYAGYIFTSRLPKPALSAP